MLTYFKKKWLFCSYIILLGIIVALLSIFQGIMLQIIIDTAVGNLTIGFLKIIMIVCLYVIMNYLFNLLYKRNLYKITTDAIAHIKNKLIDSFLIEKNIESQNLTETLSIMEKDISQVFENYYINFFVLINEIILFLVSTCYLCFTNIILTIVVLFSGIVSILIPQIFIPHSQRVNASYLNSNKEYVHNIKELINGLTTIKIFDLDDEIKEKVQDSNLKLEKNHRYQINYQAFIECLSSSMSFFALVCNVVFAGYLSYKGYFTIGTVLAVMQIMNFVMYPLMQIPSIIIEMKSVKPAINNIQKYICENEYEKKENVTQDVFNSLSFEHVSFKLIGAREFIVEDINISFEKGKKYAIIGNSGSGKTTLLKLILGFYKNFEGNILINNENLKNKPLKQWRRNITVVEQDIFLFNDSIQYNICFAKENPYVNLFDLINLVGLKDFILAKEENIDYVIDEHGANISGGEKKRLAMARALYKQSKIILADEPTSGLDATNAKRIEDILINCERMVINVTHNLDKEVLQKYDEIICMRNGRIVGIGDYETLYTRNSYFYKLCNDFKSEKQI